LPHVGGIITAWGPLLNVVVSVSVPRFSALTAAGHPIPSPVVAKLLVDTGASQTAIDGTILGKLGLTPTGTQQIHTPSTTGVPHSANLYDVAIAIFGADTSVPAHAINALAVIDGAFQPQGIDGLLGRDVLAVCRMTYGGPDQYFMVSF
jgi:hypothetical protein